MRKNKELLARGKTEGLDIDVSEVGTENQEGNI